MRIAGYLKTSLIEWPGKIASVIFTPGCNFRCPFCHNADLVDRSKDSKLPKFTEEEILEDLQSRKKWVDVAVITGGEPTLQKDLPDFLEKVGNLGFLRMIHTNGSNPDVIAQLLNCSIVESIAMDIKGPLDEYERFTKVKSSKFNPSTELTPSTIEGLRARVQSSIETIIKSGVEYEFRTTVVPTLHNLKNLISLAEQIKFLVQSSPSESEGKVQNCRWFLQQFRPLNTFDKSYLKVEPFSEEKMKNFQKELQKIIPNTFLRGV